MECSSNQCCAPNTSNTRCTNSVNEGTNHCDIHRSHAMKLYHRYKTLSDKVDNLNINQQFPKLQDRINHVMRCYVLLNKTFSARTKHRKYAFVPECYDEGHDYQFVKLKGLIDKCENILGELYSSTPSESDSTESDGSVEGDLESIDTTVKASVTKYRKYRRNIENDIERWINKYIQDNKIILERRELLAKHIAKITLEMFDTYGCEYDEELDYSFEKCVMMFHLSRRLHNMGYLPKDSTGKKNKAYVPQKCRHCNCNEYEATDLKLGCGCIFEANTISKYLNLCSEDTLKQYYGTLLFNKEKIIPILSDIKLLYALYGNNLLFMKLYLLWDPLKQRLVIEQNMNTTPMKQSRLMAATRLKNKVYQKRYQQMEPFLDR